MKIDARSNRLALGALIVLAVAVVFAATQCSGDSSSKNRADSAPSPSSQAAAQNPDAGAQKPSAQESRAQEPGERQNLERVPDEEDRGFVLGGFKTPESVLHDMKYNTYLVSNINGSPTDHDDNGFISRVSPEGEMVALAWIDGGAPGVRLNAPKGSAVRAEQFFVADIDTIRIFNRATGAPEGAIGIPGAEFLNDLVAATDGTLYVSDTNTGKVHRIAPDRKISVLIEGSAIGKPNGLALRNDTLWVARMDAPRIEAVTVNDGRVVKEVEVPEAQLDGLVILRSGAMLVSSWAGQAIYRVSRTEAVETVFSNLRAPADIGFDIALHTVLIPLFQDDRIESRPLPRKAARGGGGRRQGGAR